MIWIWCLRVVRTVAGLEVVADGLPLFHGAQWAIDTTLVSPVGRNGLPMKRGGNVSRADWSIWPDEGRGLRVKWAGGGLRRRSCSCGSSPRQKPVANQSHNKRVPGAAPSVDDHRGVWSARAFSQSLLEARGGGRCDGLTPSTAEVESTGSFAVWHEPPRVGVSKFLLM